MSQCERKKDTALFEKLRVMLIRKDTLDEIYYKYISNLEEVAGERSVGRLNETSGAHKYEWELRSEAAIERVIEACKYERPGHRDRLRTLVEMARLWYAPKRPELTLKQHSQQARSLVHPDEPITNPDEPDPPAETQSATPSSGLWRERSRSVMKMSICVPAYALAETNSVDKAIEQRAKRAFGHSHIKSGSCSSPPKLAQETRMQGNPAHELHRGPSGSFALELPAAPPASPAPRVLARGGHHAFHLRPRPQQPSPLSPLSAGLSVSWQEHM